MRILKLFISFFTRFYIHVDNFDLKEIGKNFHFIIVIGYIYGFLSLFFGKLFLFLKLPDILVGVIILFILEYFNSFQHFDGLLDFGDGWMSFNNKIEALKDKYIGVGAFAFGFFITLISAISYGYLLAKNIFMLLVIEVLCRLGVLSCATFGNHLKEGSGKYIVKYCNEKNLTIGLIFTLPLLIFGYYSSLGILLSIFIGFYMSKISRNLFGGVNGDILGATNEICRAVLSLVFLIILNF